MDKKYKLDSLNKLKTIRNNNKIDLYNTEIEVVKIEIFLLNY